MSENMDTRKDMVHYLKKINFILDNVEKQQGKKGKKDLKILDVGCGVGNISIEIAKLGCDVLGIDSDKNSIDYANKRKRPKNCEFLVSNAHELKIKEKFDIIICSEVLEHLTYPENLIGFISKNIKEDGFVFISIPNGFGPAELSCMPRRWAGKLLKKINLFETAKRIRHSIVKDSVKKAQKSFGLDTLNTHGDGALHEQFFSIGSLKKLLGKFNFEIVNSQNSFIFVGTFPFYYFYSKSRELQKADCIMADYVPSFISSGWSFIIKLRIN